MTDRTDLLHSNSENLQSHETSLSSRAAPGELPVPDEEAAAILSTIIDYGRLALGWNRLQETEQFSMVCSFYLDLTDEDVPRERWMDCYRAAKKRRRQMIRDGKQVGALAADDLIVEWDLIKRMHVEIDKTRLLPENAAAACLRCFGKKPAVDTCDHRPLSKEELDEQARARVEEVKRMRADLANKPAIKSMPAEEFKMDLSVTYTCTACGRKAESWQGWNYHDCCNARLPGPIRDGETLGCSGVMEVL